MNNRPTIITFLLIEEFAMLAVDAVIDPLRQANRLLGWEAYRWVLISHDGQPVPSSNGMVVSVHGALSDVGSTDFLFVCAGLEADPPYRQRLHAGLRRAARGDTVIGGVSAGPLILARAGLLDGYRSTVHWEWQPAFREEFPELETEPGLFVIDRDRWTGSGGISGIDMMLGLIARDHGDGLSRAVGNQFQIDQIRTATVHQRPGRMDRLATLPAPLQRAIDLMLANTETPLRVEEIADAIGLNVRRLERMFNANLDASPARYYRRLRLERARDLLLHTNLPMLEVACLTGFASSSHFAMAYQRQFGQRPSQTRRPRRPDRAEGNEGEGTWQNQK